MSLKRWKLGLFIALLSGVFTGLIGLGVGMTWRQILILMAVNIGKDGLLFLQQNPADKVDLDGTNSTMKGMEGMKMTLFIICLATMMLATTSRAQTNAMPDFAKVEAALVNPATWTDNLGVDVGVFCNTKAPRWDTSLLAGKVTYSTGSNTFLEVGAFYGLRERGGGAAAGGLKAASTITLPVIHKTIRTVQSVAAGIAYVSGTSGTVAYGVSLPAQHRMEDYVETSVVVMVGARGRIGGTALVIGTDAYIGLGGGITF